MVSKEKKLVSEVIMNRNIKRMLIFRSKLVVLLLMSEKYHHVIFINGSKA